MTELRDFLGKQFDAVYEKTKTIQKAIDDTIEYLEKPKEPEGKPCHAPKEKPEIRRLPIELFCSCEETRGDDPECAKHSKPSPLPKEAGGECYTKKEIDEKLKKVLAICEKRDGMHDTLNEIIYVNVKDEREWRKAILDLLDPQYPARVRIESLRSRFLK